MPSRIHEVPVLKSMPTIIDAAHYNRIRLALLRLENPLRFTLSHLRGLDVLLNDEAWVCVDRTMNDLPVLAWTDFETRGRSGLHEPVRCQLRFYHAHAGIIIKTLLQDIDAELSRRMAMQNE
jgi:hypothetical protein